MTAKNDTLPPRFTEDPMPEGPAKGKVHDILEPLKQEWYQIHDWDIHTGIPSPEKLNALGLPDVAHDLQQRHII
jgi:aldehyde:ferredoxin oxidoreductase